MATSKFSKSTDKASEEFHEFACTPCTGDDSNVEAVKYCMDCNEYLCTNCLKYHDRFAAMKLHKLLNKADMKGKKPQPATFVTMERCMLHNGNPIDTYCGNHDEVCCPTCVSVIHRSCVDITYILDAASGFLKSIEYKTITVDIGKVKAQLEQLKKTKQGERSRLEKEKEANLILIKEFRKKINQHLDDLEKEALVNVRDSYKEWEDNVNGEIKALEETVKLLETSIDQLKTANTDNEQQVFVKVKMGKRNQADGSKLLNEMQASPRNGSFAFKPNTAVDTFIDSLKSLGDFTEDTGMYKASLLGQYDVRIGNETTCDIAGSCQLSDGTILITDWENENLKRLNQSYTVIDHCDLSSNPFAVCATGPDEAAITLNNYNIQFVSLGHKLTTTKSFEVSSPCRGLAYSNGELFIACQSPSMIQTYNTAGQLLRTFQTDAAGHPLFSCPRHVTVSTDGTTRDVADSDGVTTLDINGSKQSQFRNSLLNSAWCACRGPNNQMFVCGELSNNVLQISDDGQTTDVLVDETDGLTEPLSLIYDHVNSRLIVTMISNKITVFKLTKK